MNARRLAAGVIGFAIAIAVATAQQTITPIVGPDGQTIMFATGSPVRDNTPEPAGTGRIRGRVVDAETGAVLHDTVLTLTGGGLRQARTLGTDDQGRFEFETLPAGRFNLSANKPGYMALAYGQRRPFESGRPIDLADKQTLENVDFAIPRGGVIVARITDENGEPVTGVRVIAYRLRYGNGQRVPTPVSSTNISAYATDDRGEMRVYGLPPGEYFVGTTTSIASSGFGLAEDGRRYVPTYYPGTPSIDNAQKVNVQIAKEVNVSFPMVATKMARVTGVVRRPEGMATARGSVQLLGRSPGALGRGATMQPDGTFSVTDITPGEYAVEARLTIGDTSSVARGATPTLDREFGRTMITVSGADMTSVVVNATKGGTIRGRIAFDGERPASLRLATVQPYLTSTGPVVIANVPTVQEDGSFAINTVFDPGVVRIQTLPAGWFLKSVSLNGKDITDTPVSVDNGGDLAGVEIVLTQKRAGIAGTAADDKGTAVSDYTVVIFPEDRTQWTPASRFIFTARPDQQGRFRLLGMPPGKYLVTALDYLETGSERDPDVLDRLRGRASAVTLAEGDPGTVTLTIQ